VEKNNEYYPLVGFDMLASQMTMLKKKFTSYKSFAGKPIEEVFTDEQLENSAVYEVHTLASGFLENNDGKFVFVSFSDDLQTAPIMAMTKFDFDRDGNEELLLAGNYFGVQPFHGRYGSFAGALIRQRDDIASGHSLGLKIFNKSVRQLNVIPYKNENYLIVTINNDQAQIYKLAN
jgi:enediyne biosynthesis protein E4